MRMVEDMHLRCRELQLADIELRWPGPVRDRLRTNEGPNRIYGIWKTTFLSGLFDHLWMFLDPTKAAVDVGALLGQYSLTLAACSTRCLCIEPLEQYQFLAEALPPNCIVLTVAVGASPGTAVIRSPVEPDGSVEFGLSSLVRQEWPEGYTSFREQETQVRPLDELVAESLGNEPIGFIKIDAEENEVEVLRGAKETLARHRPAVQVEVHPRNVAEVSELMASLGYRGLFFHRRRLHDLSRLKDVHVPEEHRWTPQSRDRFDPDLVVSDFYFIPADGDGHVPTSE